MNVCSLVCTDVGGGTCSKASSVIAVYDCQSALLKFVYVLREVALDCGLVSMCMMMGKLSLGSSCIALLIICYSSCIGQIKSM